MNERKCATKLCLSDNEDNEDDADEKEISTFLLQRMQILFVSGKIGILKIRNLDSILENSPFFHLPI